MHSTAISNNIKTYQNITKLCLSWQGKMKTRDRMRILSYICIILPSATAYKQDMIKSNDVHKKRQEQVVNFLGQY